MAGINLKTRIVHKHDVESNWLLATNFTPEQGEIIIYDKDANYDYERLKIGDGQTNVSSLPFILESITNAEIDELCANTLPEGSLSESQIDELFDKII